VGANLYDLALPGFLSVVSSSTSLKFAMSHHHHHPHLHHLHHSEGTQPAPGENPSEHVSTFDKVRGSWKEFEGKVQDNPDKYQQGHNLKHPEESKNKGGSA